MNTKTAIVVLIVIIVLLGGFLFYIGGVQEKKNDMNENEIMEDESTMVDEGSMEKDLSGPEYQGPRVAPVATNVGDSIKVKVSQDDNDNLVIVGALLLPGSCIGLTPEVSLGEENADGTRDATINLVSDPYEGEGCTSTDTSVPFQVSLPISLDSTFTLMLNNKDVAFEIVE